MQENITQRFLRKKQTNKKTNKQTNKKLTNKQTSKQSADGSCMQENITQRFFKKNNIKFALFFFLSRRISIWPLSSTLLFQGSLCQWSGSRVSWARRWILETEPKLPKTKTKTEQGGEEADLVKYIAGFSPRILHVAQNLKICHGLLTKPFQTSPILDPTAARGSLDSTWPPPGHLESTWPPGHLESTWPPGHLAAAGSLQSRGCARQAVAKEHTSYLSRGEI